MSRTARSLLTFVLLGFALFPVAVLVLASGLPEGAAPSDGISMDLALRWSWRGYPRLFEISNRPLWFSLARTLTVSVTVSAVASTISIISSYLATRRRSSILRNLIRFLSLAAYGLPSIFLVLAYEPILRNLALGPDGKIWVLHFLYILPLGSVLSLAYAEAHPYLLDRSAAVDGIGWRGRLWHAWRGNLWRAHLGILCIGILVSWGDIVFSRHFLSSGKKLIVDLYILRYFEIDTTSPDYAGAAMFALVLTAIAAVLAYLVARVNRDGR